MLCAATPFLTVADVAVHRGGCQSDGRLQAGDAKSPGLLLSKSQDHDSPRMQALIRCKEENVPVVLLAGTKFKDAPFLAGMGPDVRYAGAYRCVRSGP